MSFEVYDHKGDRIVDDDTKYPKFIDDFIIDNGVMSGNKSYILPDYLYLSFLMMPLTSNNLFFEGNNNYALPIVYTVGNNLYWHYSPKTAFSNSTIVYQSYRILVFGF
ncbi:MAG: hypothetical protein Q4G42_05130 [Neisseria sp.]|nr:hypothetical protein [Neisseria sp.]